MLHNDINGEEEDGPVIQLPNGFMDPLTAALDVISPKRSSTLFESLLAGDPDSLLSLETRFQSLVIEELELVKASVTSLNSTIKNLEMLRLDVVRYKERESVKASESVSRKIEEILNAIAREISLYEQFASADSSRLLTLENILKHDDVGGDEDHALSPKGPPTDTMSEQSTSDVRLRGPSLRSPNRRSSISSFGSGPSRHSTLMSNTGFLNGRFHHVVPPGPNDIFRWTTLRALSDNVMSDSMTQRVGMPTVFAVSGGIAIGTSRSMVLIYDLAQSLKAILGDSSSAVENGAVTAIAISPNQMRVACGYAQGDIHIWDVAKRTIVRSIQARIRGSSLDNDGHIKGVTITQLSFINGNSELISADKEGSVFYHSISKILLLRSVVSVRLQGQPHQTKSAAIFSVSALPHSQSTHFTDARGLMAIATPYRLLVLCTKPVPAIIFKMPWVAGNASGIVTAVSISCLAWLPSFRNTSDEGKSSTDPVVAMSAGSRLVFLRLQGRQSQIKTKNAEIEFITEGEWDGVTNIVGLQWINNQFIAALMSTEEVVLIDTYNFSETERCDIGEKRILSFDFYSKSLDSLGLTSEMAYHSSFRSFKGRLFFLGVSSIEVASPLSWIDRLTALVRSGGFEDALRMALGFYRGDGVYAATGIPAETVTREKLLGDYISSLIQTYISMALSSYEKDCSEADNSSLISLTRLCIDTFLNINREDILFSDIFEKFSENGLEQLFFENLEPFILDARVTLLDNPALLQIEQIILHLDPFSLDLHGIIGLCKEYGLMSALIYLYNKAVQDYVSPLIELLKIVEAVLDGSEIEVVGSIPVQSRCYTLYMYLAYTLTGKAFPVGTLSKRESLRAKTDIYNFLFSQTHIPWPPEERVKSSVEIGKNPLPYLTLLLRYDAEELLKVLSLALDDISLDGEIRVRDGSASEGKVRFADEHTEFSRQMIVQYLITASETDEIAVDRDTIVALNIFLAKIYVKFRSSINFGNSLLDSISEILVEADGEGNKQERQLALCSLFSTYTPSNFDIMSDEFAERCEKKQLWRVCELLYSKREQYSNVLKSYLFDTSRSHESFKCLRDLLVNKGLTYAQIWDVKQFIFASMSAFVQLDSKETALTILDLMPGDIAEVIQKLELEETLLYKFLSGLLDDSKETRRGQSASLNDYDTPPRRFPNRLYERYIELMCAYQPSALVSYLIYLSETLEGDPYPLDKVLSLCETAQIHSASLWLYERMGDFKGALRLVSNLLQGYFAQIEKEIAELRGDHKEEEDVSRKLRLKASLSLIKSTYDSGVQMCRRSSGKLSKEDQAELWFCLMDAVLDFQLQVSLTFGASPLTPGPPTLPLQSCHMLNSREPSPSRDAAVSVMLVQSVRALTERLLEDLVGKVSASSILGRILQATQSKATFGEYKDIIFCMLESHSYERELLQAVTRTQGQDVHTLMVRAKRTRARALRPDRGHCGICKRPIHTDAFTLQDFEDHVVIFRCHHSFHRSCLQEKIKLEQESPADTYGKQPVEPVSDKGHAWCISCDPKGQIRTLIRRRMVIKAGSYSHGKKSLDDRITLTEFKEGDALSRQVADVEHFHSILEKMPTGSSIFNALRPSDISDEDRIDMNEESFRSALGSPKPFLRSNSSFGGNGEDGQPRLIPAPVLKLLLNPTFDLSTNPQGRGHGAGSGLDIILAKLDR